MQPFVKLVSPSVIILADAVQLLHDATTTLCTTTIFCLLHATQKQTCTTHQAHSDDSVADQSLHAGHCTVS